MLLTSALLALALPAAQAQDWPTLRGTPERSGYAPRPLPPGPYGRAWAVHFEGERLGSAMEPIVGAGRLYVATHSGNLYALDAGSGKPLWRFQAAGPFLHSPAYAADTVVAGSLDGRLYAVEAATGKPRWSVAAEGGVSASPTVVDGTVFIGARGGEFLAVELGSGRVLWRDDLGVPVRQSAAASGGRVFVTGEDLRVRAYEAGRRMWTSDPLWGQTARDYYPVLAGKGKLAVVTNSVINISDRMWRDTQRLAKIAGAGEVTVSHDGRRKIQAWARREDLLGTTELWEREQAGVIAYLREEPAARSFYLLEVETGRDAGVAPVLGVVGNGGAPTPPVVLPDGRLLVFHRTAYGNWNLGYHVWVGLGLLDLEKNRIEPLTHGHGKQPPWNTFWGTADESQNFTAGERGLFIVHQDTLSVFDRGSRALALVGGNRDTWGGFRNLPWVRNEWHGPARGGVALAGRKIFWLTGSRVLAFETAGGGAPAGDVSIRAESLPAERAPAPPGNGHDARLARAVEEAISRQWAPLYVDPGVGWREFFFEDSSALFESLSWAYPHLPEKLRARVGETLAREWEARPPFSKQALYALDEGERREYFAVPREALRRAGYKKSPHRFGGVYAAWLYAERCGAGDRLGAAWEEVRQSFEEFVATGWRLEPDRGDYRANRYLAALLAFEKLARRRGEDDLAKRAAAMADEAARGLADAWRRAAERSALRVFSGIKDWDEAILKGEGGLFVKLKEHNHKPWLFHDLTPEVAARVASPEAAARVWGFFQALAPTWHATGEEHQIHTGENFLDPPDFARGAFRASLWTAKSPAGSLRGRVDVPFCRADLHYIEKLALTLERR